MSDFVTIATFTYPHEAAILKSKLESEGIMCFLKDEYTVQAHNFYSNAVGGVKLQVSENDISKAVPILREAGYLQETEEEPSETVKTLDRISAKIPVINYFRYEVRLFISVAIFLIILVVFLFIVFDL